MKRIALVMIARDEARCIERCLKSAAPHVDTMIVYDTGSHDDTRERAASAGARVIAGAWNDDFAAARNAALAHADADWLLVLDADEWIAGGSEALAVLRREGVPFLGVVTVVNLFDNDGGETCESPSWIPRVLPRGVGYAGRIHEQPEAALPRRRLALQIRHDGYLRSVMQAKRERNRRLLELALAERPDDAYLAYQFAKDLELRGEFDAARPHYERALAAAEPAATWRHDLVLRLVFTLKKCARHERALALIEAETPRFDTSPDLHFAHGDVLLDWAASDPQRALQLVPAIEACWLRAAEIGERPDLPDSVRGRGSFLAAHNLAVLNAGLGRREQAQAWRERERRLREADALRH